MPVLSNARHEAFAQARAKGMSQDEAYINAGFKKNDSNAARLNGNERIQERIAELLAKSAVKAVVTVHSIAQELDEARAIAISNKQTSAAVAASMGKAKLFGLGVENRKVTGTIQVVTITAKHLDGLSDHEISLLESAYPVLQKLGLIGSDQAGETEA